MKSLLPEREGLPRFLSDQGWHSDDVTRRMGAANRHGVFLLERGDRKAVLKVHEPVVPRRRDAFAHEALLHAFYVEEVGEAVPRLRAQDAGTRAFLFNYVPGAALGVPAIDAVAVQRMADFLIKTNRPDVLERARKRQIPAASESGFSAVEHWHCAMSRVDDLLAVNATNEVTSAMQAFVKSEVRPALVDSKPHAVAVVTPCLSPSDFGFHNVIRREDGSFCFLDFEHAGWDDPAKLLADFILQPEALLSDSAAQRFVQALGSAPPFDHGIASQAAQILGIQKCKWTAIILNVFSRSVADPAIKAARLDKAREYWRSKLPNL